MRNDIDNIDAISADIASIPGTPQGDQLIARMISGQDPIKRLLASLEANKRARTRQQAKAPQMQQGRPPVVQEKAQQLLASGIGSLPVDNQVFQAAGGGIVAFEDGGEVRHFFNGGTSDPSYEALEDYDPNKFTRNEFIEQLKRDREELVNILWELYKFSEKDEEYN